jgi:hypothetical protein
VLCSGSSELNVENTGLSYNLNGVRTTAGTIRIHDTFITGNTTGISIGGGVVKSWGRNRVVGNITDGAPTAPNLIEL